MPSPQRIGNMPINLQVKYFDFNLTHSFIEIYIVNYLRIYTSFNFKLQNI